MMFVAQHRVLPPSELALGAFLILSIPVTLILSIIASVFALTARRTRRSSRILSRICLVLSTCNVVGVLYLMTKIHFVLDTSASGMVWPLGFATGFILSQVAAFCGLSQPLPPSVPPVHTTTPDA